MAGTLAEPLPLSGAVQAPGTTHRSVVQGSLSSQSSGVNTHTGGPAPGGVCMRIVAVVLPQKSLSPGLYRLELPNLSAGVYFVQCKTGEKITTRKVVKTATR